ncbi:MAG: VPS10 domain-containing protein [Acidobacteriota bacterium]
MRPFAALAISISLAATAPAASIDPDLLAGLKARSIGPAGMSGRIADIQAVETDPSVVYVGATGGVWKSVNGGLTFTPIFDDQPVAAIGALAVFQPNPRIVWAGTGEGNVRNSVSVGNGVYRSTDGGETWKHVGLDGTERISRIVLHPTDPNVAWVAALGRLWGENEQRGVFKTTDGGATWTKVLYVDARTGAADLAIDPSDPNALFAAMWQYRRWPYFFRSGGPGSGLFVSRDGGASWKKLQPEDGLPKGTLGRIGVAFCRSHPEVVYALVEAEKSALLRSEDGGRTFKTVNDTPNISPRPFYFADIRVDPHWPNRVYRLDYGVAVSDDGGKTFANLPGSRAAHGDNHAMWIDPRDPEHLLVGDDGGVYESRDRGKTVRFVTTLPLAQFYHVNVDNQDPYHAMGGLQDNSSWHGPAEVREGGGIRTHHWKLVGSGDGYDVATDPREPEVGYSMWQGGYLNRFDLRDGTLRAVRPPAPKGVALRFNWNSALALDPFAPGTLYYGSQFVHRSADRGESWEVISPDLTTNRPEWQRQDDSGGLTFDVTAAENYCTLLTIAPSPVAKGVIWTGSDDGRIHVTRDGGATWTAVEANVKGVPENTWIPHIEASRFDAGEAFVVFDDHRRSNWKTYVYRTRDFGRTWTSLATPDLRGWALVVEQDPVRRDLLFLGTEFGLYASLDGGASWLPFRHGVPTVSVMDLTIQERECDLVVATHGRALFVVDDITPLREMSAAPVKEKVRLFAPTPAVQHRRAPEAGGFGLGHGEFRGENEPYGAILTYWLDLPDLPLPDTDREKTRRERARAAAAPTAWGPEPALRPDAKAQPADEDPNVEIVVADASGAPVRTFKGPAKLGLNRAVWDLSRDAFREFPRVEPRMGDWEPRGPEVVPGRYTVTVKIQGQEARASVEVHPDPRTRNTPEEWARREQAVARVKAVHERAAGAAHRLRDMRADVEAVMARARTSAEREAQAAGRLPSKDDPQLVVSGKALLEKLGALEKRLWQPPETVGIVADNDVAAKISRAALFVGATPSWSGHGSPWDPPSPAQIAYLSEAEAAFAALEPDIDAFLVGDVAAYRAQADAAGIRLLAP